MSNYNQIGMIALSAMLLFLAQYSVGAGLGWVLYGHVIDASTCNGIAGAHVGSPYNGGAFNATNSSGGYRLVLGTGNWSVTVSAAGYHNGSNLTPYYTNGAFLHNFSLVPVGGSARSPPCGSLAGTTVINNTNTTITPGVNPNATTAQPTVVSNSTGSQNGGGFSGADAALVIVVIIIVVVVAYVMTKGKKPPHHEHHEQHHEHHQG